MAKKYFYRTLVRAERIVNDQVMLVIPVWELNLSFPIPMSILPDNLRTSLSN